MNLKYSRMDLPAQYYAKMVVPWFNTDEWKYVYNLIYSKGDNQLEALKILQMWKTRIPKLSSGVEGTLIILEAMLENPSSLSEEKLRLIYGTSLMRFLNVCVGAREKQGTFYKVAKRHNLPAWLVNLRHDLAHDQTIPSKYMLLLSLKYCLNWLKTEYWEKQWNTLTDLVIEKEQHEEFSLFVKSYCHLLALHHNNTTQTLSEIRYIDSNNQLLQKLQCYIQIDDNTTLEDLLNILMCIIKNLISQNDKKFICNIVVDVLVKKKYLFVSTGHSNGIASTNTLQMWQELISVIYKEDMLFSVISALVDMLYEPESIYSKYAALWLTEIFNALHAAKLKSDNHNSQINYDTAKPNRSLNFDFKYRQSIFNQLQLLEDKILDCPYDFPKQDFLNFRNYFKGYIDDYHKLNDLFYKAEITSQLNKTYSVNDLPEINKFKNRKQGIFAIDTEMDTSELPKLFQNKTETSRWKLVQDTSIFESCPLGIILHQVSLKGNPLWTYS